MNENLRNKALLEIIRQCLEYADTINTNKNLGNRAGYLGISDLARYAECPRAALHDKLIPQSNSLDRLLTMQRGHWFENGIADCFNSIGMSFLRQLEISLDYQGAPVKAHLDFTFVWQKPQSTIRIIEIKSVNKLPEQPYESHCIQAQAQVDLLSSFWSEPVFSLKDEAGILSGKMTLPDIIKKYTGTCLPNLPDKISVESWLVYLSMKDASCFGPFVSNKTSLDILLESSREMWFQYIVASKDMEFLNHIPHAKGYHPLCAYCQGVADCPKFVCNQDASYWNDTISHLLALKRQKYDLDEQIKAIENDLKQVAAISDNGDWLETGDYRFRTTQVSGRRSLDRGLLVSHLDSLFQSIGLTEIDTESIISKCEKQSAPSSRLQILPLK